MSEPDRVDAGAGAGEFEDDLPGADALVEQESVLRSSTLMGIGTIVSRASGVVRGAALAAAIGVAGPVADLFGLGNTLPNIVYILVIGGALNAVFVPQLVRHMKHDSDGGSAFADRLMTLVGVAMLVTTIIAVLAAPWIVELYTSNKYTPEQIALAVDITRYCLPQIFFYGVYTMVSQVLNARGRFAAPMFAPIVNNVVSVAAFLTFVWLWGSNPAREGMLTPAQTALLGIGSTLGVAAQAAVLVPYMSRTGYHYRPRFDWRGAGLGRAGSLAFWTVGLVLVNQAAYVVIVRLLGDAGADATASDLTAGGLVTYQNAHLIFILPHSIITVSLVTALLPRMSRAASESRWADLADYVAGGARTAAAAIIPAAAALIVLGPTLAQLLFGYGAANDEAGSVHFLGQVVSIFAFGLLPFTTFYLVLRGWYAMEETRTAFWATVFLNAVNLALALLFFNLITDSTRTDVNAVTGIAAAYVIAYWVTALLAWRVLSRRLGGLQTGRTVRALARMVAAAAVALGVMYLVQVGVMHALSRHGKLVDLIDLAAVGVAGLAAYLAMARLLRVHEVTEVMAVLRARIAR
ncbi:MAG TPA: murein biosynthesis integral membrane protein MurJ [Candidatus Nanopelagicales bacterium]|jgi:putative peptidoglycan lipid II flippase